MAIVNTTYDGVDMSVFEVELEIAETDFTLVHGKGFAIASISPKDAGFYTQQVLLKGLDLNSIDLEKTAGAVASLQVVVQTINSSKFG